MKLESTGIIRTCLRVLALEILTKDRLRTSAQLVAGCRSKSGIVSWAEPGHDLNNFKCLATMRRLTQNQVSSRKTGL